MLLYICFSGLCWCLWLCLILLLWLIVGCVCCMFGVCLIVDFLLGFMIVCLVCGLGLLVGGELVVTWWIWCLARFCITVDG